MQYIIKLNLMNILTIDGNNIIINMKNAINRTFYILIMARGARYEKNNNG
jgi:hypothetical protein